MASIPFYEQFYVEKERNIRYQWLNYLFCVMVFIVHGVLFYWIPRFLRNRRSVNSMKFKPFFVFLDVWESLNRCFSIRVPFTKYVHYYQPSLLILFVMFIIVNTRFCYLETADIDYLPRLYVIGKRVGRVGLGNLPMVYLLVTKNDLVSSITGLQHDRIVHLHQWFARLVFVMITIHMALCIQYWLSIDFLVMLNIPPQIFGFIAYACLFLLTFANVKIIRRWAFDFFMVQHRIFSFIMLLLAFFHNGGSKAMVVLAVHQLVLDKIASRIFGIIHTRKSPTKGISEFEILDDETYRVTLTIKKSSMDPKTWYNTLLPKYGTWKAGQHIYLTVGKVSRFQMHPFTIYSLAETGKIKLVIRKKNGFTKKLMNKIAKMKEEQLTPSTDDSDNDDHTADSLSIHEGPKDLNIVKLKATFQGPYGGKYHTLTTFDSVAFFAAGSGASFTFPVCLDLMQTIEEKEINRDYLYRPKDPYIRFYWAIKKSDNITWYNDILKKLLPYVDSGKLMIDIYVTQEDDGDIDVQDILHKVSEKNPTENSIAQSSKYHVGPVITCGERPNLGDIVAHHVNYLKVAEDHFYKALALLSCGPHSFNNMIKIESQKHRWTKDSPSIYYYDEAFD
ncbi:ferric reductase [Scheffersomyces xylosifermentans]|uniref:ferric reductase n=1 Tax=Scheffersomyces xylosifermentans TaxID=1304137 RepID=UPI00315DA541